MMIADATSFDRDDLYLKYNREVREGLRAIGLSERSTPVQSLQAYLEKRAAGKETNNHTSRVLQADRGESNTAGE